MANCAQQMYEGITSALEASTDPMPSATGTLFDATLRYVSVDVAMEIGLDPVEAAHVFADVATSAVNTSDDFVVTVVHQASPTTLPTSMPSCGVGSERLESGLCNECPAGSRRDFGHVTSGRACVLCPIDSISARIVCGNVLST